MTGGLKGGEGWLRTFKSGSQSEQVASASEQASSEANATNERVERLASLSNRFLKFSRKPIWRLPPFLPSLKRLKACLIFLQIIATAVSEQWVAMQEIAGNVTRASSGTQEVSSNIGQVTEAAQSIGQTTEVVNQSSQV
ncbi:MAG: hypothetical protein OIF56_08160 [Cohaesibacter sp.]|nr:hypothetical protein [Cohaesibacter sp.]